MQIKDIKINWMEKWDNDPYFEVIVDNLPKWEDMRFEEHEGLYVAEKEGVVYYIYKQNPSRADDGFGGRRCEIIMKDNSKICWYGGWSSRAGCVNKLFPEIQMLDVVYQTNKDKYPFISSGILKDTLEKALLSLGNRKFGIKRIVKWENEIYYIPCIKDKYLLKTENEQLVKDTEFSKGQCDLFN